MMPTADIALAPLTPQERDRELARSLATRQADWLREFYGITPAELDASPRSTREDIAAAWSRYWRYECEHGRGIKAPERTGGTPRGSHRL